jgi:hypothetical protein
MGRKMIRGRGRGTAMSMTGIDPPMAVGAIALSALTIVAANVPSVLCASATTQSPSESRLPHAAWQPLAIQARGSAAGAEGSAKSGTGMPLA